MIADNPSQQARLAELEPIIQEKLEDLAIKVRLLDGGDMASAISLLSQDKGRELMTAIKERVAHICAEEQRLLATRSEDSTRASRQLLFVGMADSFAILLLGWLAISFSLRTTQSLEAAKAALEAKVEERVAELREANDELQSFAYIVGHDLRAPLVNIMGFTSELQTLRDAIFKQLAQAGEASNGKGFDDKAAEAEFDEAIGFIKAATVKMERLISAVLAISRTGKRELKPENIDMSALVNGVVTTLAHEAQAVDAEIEVGTLPPVHCDRLAARAGVCQSSRQCDKVSAPWRARAHSDHWICRLRAGDLRSAGQWSGNRRSGPTEGLRAISPRRRTRSTGRGHRTRARARAGSPPRRIDQAYVDATRRLDLQGGVALRLRRSVRGKSNDARDHHYDRGRWRTRAAH